jgi:hypothetical protein
MEKQSNDFFKVLPGMTKYRSECESLKGQAAVGVWNRARQWDCLRNEPRLATGRDTGVSGVLPSSELCMRWLLKWQGQKNQRLIIESHDGPRREGREIDQTEQSAGEASSRDPSGESSSLA